MAKLIGIKKESRGDVGVELPVVFGQLEQSGNMDGVLDLRHGLTVERIDDFNDKNAYWLFYVGAIELVIDRRKLSNEFYNTVMELRWLRGIGVSEEICTGESIEGHIYKIRITANKREKYYECNE